tara:strand:- start:1119 stop:2735 length:1617 start_codon:yes stop_codon:yes gene_type:complete
MAEIVTVKLVAETGDAVKNVEKVEKAVEKTEKTTKKASKELSSMQQIGNETVKGLDRLTGGLASKFVAVGKAAKLSGKAMRTALISSGIGLAVAAVGLLVEYWDEIGEALGFINKDLERQVELNNQNLDAVGSRLRNIQTLIELRKREGKDVELLLKKEKELTEQKKQAFITSIQDQALLVNRLKLKQKEGKLNEEDTKELQKQEGVYLDLINTFNKFKSDLLEPVKEVVVKEAKEDPEVEAKKRSLEEIKKLEADYALSLMSDENQEKIAVATKYDDLIKQAKKYNVDTTALVAARLSEINAIEKKFEDKAKEKKAEERAANMEAFNERNDDRLKRIKENAERELEIQQDLADAEANILDAKLNFASSGVALLGQIAGESKAMSAGLLVVEKGLAIADVIINASRAIAAAKANLAATPAVLVGVPNPLYAVQAATTAKGILSTKLSAAASIATIAAQAIPGLSGGGGGGGSTSGLGGGGDTGSQAPAFNVVGASGETQLADAIGSQTQRPARAYVVSNDVTTAQEMDRNIIEGASIG